MTQQFPRRTVLTTLAAAAAGLATGTAFAEAYPDRAIRLEVGFPPGTGPDVTARYIGQRLSETMKQSVVVENKPGAGGQIASQVVAKSAPDGYTLLLAEAGSISIAPAAFSKLPYNPQQELVGVAEVAYADFVLVVPPNSPYKTLSEMVQASKGKPVVHFATFGAGSPGHFGAVEFGAQAGINVEPVHYRSTGDAVTAIVAGDVAGAWVSTAVASAQIKGGRMRGLAITAQARSPLIPDVPTAAEAGMPKLAFSSWLGVLAPAGTAPAILDLLNRRIVEAVQSPEVKQKLIDNGFSVTGTSRAETEKMLKEGAVRWGAVVKNSGFKGD